MAIRGKSIVLFRRSGEFLFTVCKEESTGLTYLIPPGGGIEFGEYSLNAARREILEELGEDICNEKLLDISENIFEYNGKAEHEIVFIYTADFTNKNAYEKPIGKLDDQGRPILLQWSSAAFIKSSGVRTYPFHLPDVLRKL